MNLAEYRKMANIEGALPNAIFNVSPTKKVVFSKGNLQFKKDGTHKVEGGGVADGTWRFAEQQWVVIEKEELLIDNNYNDWFDFFGWGTSGWNSGARIFHPYLMSNNCLDFWVGDNSANNLTGKYANADWGVYNAISNGGDQPGLWRTLTNEEWQYLYQEYRWSIGTIDKVFCFMLLPRTFSNFECVKEIDFDKIAERFFSNVECEYSQNNFTSVQFKELEKKGVVAFPCVDYAFYSKSVESVVRTERCYWSSTSFDDCNAYVFLFRKFVNGFPRCTRQSVRLVHDL